MKRKAVKKVIATSIAIILALGTFTGCAKDTDSTKDKTEVTTKEGTTNAETTKEGTDGKPDTWIADRTITIQAYVDDIGYTLPEDFNNTPVMKELTKRTGIKLNIQYTPGDSDKAVMSSQMAAGTIPDAIVCYLNNSTRGEFPILLKAAKEGLFADVSSYMKNSKVYSKYYEEGYLPQDTKQNIVLRDDLNGAAYIMHLSIPAVDRSLEYNPETAYLGGMYIQKSIVDSLGINPSEIRTQEQFYDLLVKIKEGGFKDKNGNPVYPLGPKYWGGSVDTLDEIVSGYNWGVSDGYNLDENGQVKHEVETDYVYKKIDYVRQLLADELMNPEFFTMDGTRAEEATKTGNSAICAYVSNYEQVVYGTGEWVPLGPLNDFTGDNAGARSGKNGYGAWAISSEAENPEEIFRFFDYLATEEGQILCEYGVEGVSYTMVDGKPRLTPEVQQKVDEGDKEWLINNVGAGFGGSGCVFFSYVLTDNDFNTRFGESRPGASGSSNTFATAVQIAKDYPRTYKKVPGLGATAYLSADEMIDVKEQMSLLNYKEMLVQAMFAGSEDEVKTIVESFGKQLEQTGLEKFETFVQGIYEANKESINFYK